MLIKKNILPFLFLLTLALASCSKGTELGALEKDNIMDPENTTDVFVLDSTKTTSYSIQLFYHIRYDLIKDTSKIYKIGVYKDGALYYKLLPNHINTYRPIDYSVVRWHNYAYSFALLEAGDRPSRLSAEYVLRLP